MGLDAGMSWDLGLEGHVEVLNVNDVVADIRDRTLPHVLRLPDTQLVISTAQGTTATPAFECSVAQHGVIDPRLTGWARSNYAEDITKLIETAELDVTDSQLKDLAALTRQGQWQTLQPHPATLRDHITEAAQSANERLVLSAPDLRIIPTWLQEIIQDTSERDVQIVLCPTQADLIPTRVTFPFTTSPAPASPAPDRRPHALSILTDDTHAVTHTDPAAFLERRSKPTRQHAYTTHQADAIAGLLDKLGLKRLRPPAPRYKPTPRTIASMLRQALNELQTELPNTIKASIQPEDERFALETIDRQRSPENPTQAARRAAAGIAWERILATLIHHLTAGHDELQVLAERWLPPNARIDLDLILADDTKGVTWIIDAKNANPTDDQLAKMLDQIRLLKQTPEITGGRPVIGVIVHPKRQLETPLQPTEHHDILRCTLQRLPDLLLAKRLPGERPRKATQPARGG
jgi:hypothetical protein